MYRPGAEKEKTQVRSQLGMILALFLIMRGTLLLLFSYGSPFNPFSDISFYYQTVRLSERGYYPFVNMWYEYPPVLAYLPFLPYWGAKLLVQYGLPAAQLEDTFTRLFGGLMLLFDAGTLVYLHKIAHKVWGIEKANYTAWIYASLAFPLVMLFYSHQPAAAFLLLLSVLLFLHKKPYLSAAALGLAVAAKLTPIFFLAPALRFLWPHKRRAAGYLTVFFLVIGAAYLPFVLSGSGEWVAASFQALGRAGSYATIWALHDGNWSSGYYGPLETRLHLDQAFVRYSNAPSIPPWLVAASFALVYALIFFRPVNRLDRNFIWFSTVSLMFFHLWSKGWSPQWLMMILPFVLLSFGGAQAALLCLFLTLFSTTHWLQSHVLISLSVLVRTVLLIIISAWLVPWMWPLRERDQNSWHLRAGFWPEQVRSRLQSFFRMLRL